VSVDVNDAHLRGWLRALEARHLSDLRVPEVTRALRALSSAYVERRRRPSGDADHRPVVQGTLDTAGKRAAFALFYAPLHFLTVAAVLDALGEPALPIPRTITDLGCGTGVAGAAWALTATGQRPDARQQLEVVGVDRHPWAIEETRWTYRQLGLRGHGRRGDISRITPVRRGAVIAGWALNELADESRARVEDLLIEAADRGCRVLVLEPLARSVAPWWNALAARVAGLGWRADEWRFPIDLPPVLSLFDKAAGLSHRELTARTLYVGAPRSEGTEGRPPEPSEP